jgi:rhodanese-related sulfurtransferase
MSSGLGGGYAGDVDARQAYAALADNPAAQLVDVRTREEWTFVGVPDLSAAGKQALLIEWQTWPAMSVNAGFLDALKARLGELGASPDAPLYFLCRSGVRSAAAAAASTASGFGPSHNISGGFEGPPDTTRHRGTVDGWKAHGLPWLQT